MLCPPPVASIFSLHLVSVFFNLCYTPSVIWIKRHLQERRRRHLLDPFLKTRRELWAAEMTKGPSAHSASLSAIET